MTAAQHGTIAGGLQKPAPIRSQMVSRTVGMWAVR